MEIRTKILEAALQVFSETGYRGATTRRIAQVADVNEVTLFRHFGSKEELMRAAVHFAAAEEELPRLPEAPLDAYAELSEWAEQHYRRMRSRSAMIRACMGESCEHPDMASYMCEGPKRISADLRTYIKKLEEQGLVNGAVDISAAIAMLMSALFADAINRDLMPGIYTYSDEEAPSRYVGVVLRALGVVPVVPVTRARTRRAN